MAGTMETQESGRIMTGELLRGCASFTRFVLPFTYVKRVRSVPVDGPCFAPATADWLRSAASSRNEFDLARRRYFTHETERVLFDQAGWFVFRDRFKGARVQNVWLETILKRPSSEATLIYTENMLDV